MLGGLGAGNRLRERRGVSFRCLFEPENITVWLLL